MIMGFIIYKNSRRYSNIKFTDIDECKEFIKFNGDYDEAVSKDGTLISMNILLVSL